MKTFTHNEPRVYDAMNVRLVVAATRPDWMDEAWIELDAEEVDCVEQLSGMRYGEQKGFSKLWIEYDANGQDVERWGYP